MHKLHDVKEIILRTDDGWECILRPVFVESSSINYNASPEVWRGGGQRPIVIHGNFVTMTMELSLVLTQQTFENANGHWVRNEDGYIGGRLQRSLQRGDGDEVPQRALQPPPKKKGG